MKKTAKIFLVITSILTIFAFSGCSDDQTFEKQSYSSGDSVVESVIIDVSDREVEVGISSDNQIHIEYYDSEKEFYNISVSEDKVLSVKLEYDKDWQDFIGGKSSEEYRKIKIEIPNDLLSDLTVKTTNEKIKVSSLSVLGDITLDSNGGNLEFEKISVGSSFNVTAKNGDIKGSIIGGWDDFSISCEVKKGESNLPETKTGGGKSLNVSCNNGDVNIDIDQ